MKLWLRRQNSKDSQFPPLGNHNQLNITHRWLIRFCVCVWSNGQKLMIPVLQLNKQMFGTSDHINHLKRENVVVLFVLAKLKDKTIKLYFSTMGHWKLEYEIETWSQYLSVNCAHLSSNFPLYPTWLIDSFITKGRFQDYV